MFKYYDKLVELLQPFFKEVGFESGEGEIFLKEGFAAKIDYIEEKNILELKGAKPQEGKQLEFITLSQYLFDDSSTERDLKAVAIDFEETLRGELGAKKSLAATSRVAMPQKAGVGETPTIDAFTKVFLDICPQYRDAYKEMMAETDSFLYVDFYKKYGVERMLELARGGAETKKSLGKFLSFLNKHFIEGDKAVVATVTTVIFAGAFYNNKELYETAVLPKLEEYSYLSKAATASIEYAAKNKKLQAIFQ